MREQTFSTSCFWIGTGSAESVTQTDKVSPIFFSLLFSARLAQTDLVWLAVGFRRVVVVMLWMKFWGQTEISISLRYVCEI
jgi:hypothetical protein